MSRNKVIVVQDKLSEALEDFYFNPDTPLDDKFEVMADLFLEQAARALGNMSAKDAMIGAGIAVEKMQLLRGLPTEIKASIPILVQIAERAAEENIQLTVVLKKLLQAMNE